jgi:phosphoserine phosphatase
MFYRQIEHFAFRVSPADIWLDHPERSELAKAYSVLATTPADRRRSHTAFDPFARLLLTRYFDQLAEGKVKKACTEIVQLFAGHSLSEVRVFAEETFAEELRMPMGKCQLGGQSLPRGVRFLRESVDLIRTLQEHGFDIIAVSGSNKWSVEPVFAALGVTAEHVIGIDLHAKDGILTTEATTPVPIHGGKVDILRLTDPRPPVLVASDSRNDIPLLLSSADLKVYVNSHRRLTEDFFTLGKISRDSSWVVIEEPTLISN